MTELRKKRSEEVVNYQKMNKEQLLTLIQEIELENKELKMLNQELLDQKEKESVLEFSWAGNLGHWYYNIATNHVVFNFLKVQALGYKKEEVPQRVGYEFFTNKLHPDDYEQVMQNMREHMAGLKEVYEVEYRIATKNNNWKWFYDRGKITQRDDKGRPLFAAGIVFDITEQKEQEWFLRKKNIVLEQEANFDSLTKLHNRRAIIKKLTEKMHETQVRKMPLSIVIFDLDYFKKINDSMGHVWGDKVLKKVAEIMIENIRGIDAVGRYGGEEFLLILPKADKKGAFAIGERIRLAVGKADYGFEQRITISGGVAEYYNQEIEDLIESADQNLYQAKKKGRNQIVC